MPCLDTLIGEDFKKGISIMAIELPSLRVGINLGVRVLRELSSQITVLLKRVTKEFLAKTTITGRVGLPLRHLSFVTLQNIGNGERPFLREIIILVSFVVAIEGEISWHTT